MSKSKYATAQRKKTFLGSITTTQRTNSDVKGSLIETAKDLGIGVIGGGIVGAAVGRGSLLLGLVTTFAGHYTDKRLLQAFGFGMMAANGFQTKTPAMNGLEGFDAVKQRVIAFKDSFSEKLFLDKILKKSGSMSGLGDVQYFTYNDTGMGALDLTSLDAIERQVAQSGQDFQKRQGMSGAFGEAVSGFSGADDFEGADPIF